MGLSAEARVFDLVIFTRSGNFHQMAHTVVVIDPPSHANRPVARALKSSAARADLQVRLGDGALVDELLAGTTADLVAVDLDEGDGARTGAQLIQLLRQVSPHLPIVAVASKGDVDLAARVVALGATDLLVRGPSLTRRVTTAVRKILPVLRLLEENKALDAQNQMLRDKARYGGALLGETKAMRALRATVARVAKIPRPVLIVGERGTGKELVARAIHDAAGPPGRPFVAINCAAYPDALLETELFGHERGAFTGADRAREGRFEQASTGTLFLDEIGHMSVAFQQKILRVVEYGVFQRVGGEREIRTRARVLSATNADLELSIRKGTFLSDLYDRLSFEVIVVPPLRERAADVELLARHFLHEFLREIPSLGPKTLAPSAILALQKQPLPGNVRELKNLIERGAYRDTTREITTEDMGLLPSRSGASALLGSFEARVLSYKRELLADALARAEGNQAEAARLLGLTYDKLRYYRKALKVR